MRGDGRGTPFIGELCSQSAVDAAQHLIFVTSAQHKPMIRQCGLPKRLFSQVGRDDQD
jgi:hypothetical protein